MSLRAFVNGEVFDGTAMHARIALFDGEVFEGFADCLPEQATPIDLKSDILSPGFVDLQVNGGAGVMVAAGADLAAIQAAHRRMGVTHILPTLITDTPQAMQQVLRAAFEADIAGLHLEGPHLDPSKAGAHDPALIRPMTEEDLNLYISARQNLGVLKITLAPESVSLSQVQRLVEAGVVVSLGHSNCDFETACAYFDAGVTCVTHLWNAMSPLTSRAPGLVGAALARGVASGVIADLIHVHPATLRASWYDGSFLVSDAMACAGSALSSFQLGGRHIVRAGGKLTLKDGTLAGADLDMLRAVRNVVSLGIPRAEALAAATSRPAAVVGLDGGVLTPGAPASLIRISRDLTRCSLT